MLEKYDLIVIGGGSGGVRAARIAALHGAKVVLCEKDRMGGTCVIRGCIPKKLLFYASNYKKMFINAKYYGWKLSSYKNQLDKFVVSKNNELKRLEEIYTLNAKKSGVNLLKGKASFIDNNTIKVNNRKITGKNIIIAVGGHPRKLEIPGFQYCLDSDSIMQLKKIPKSLTIIGAGYIAIEFAFIFSLLGSKINLICRNTILKDFDIDLVKLLVESLEKNGVDIFYKEQVEKISLKGKLKRIKLKRSRKNLLSEEILVAVGRNPNIKDLDLDKANIKCNENLSIKVNAKLETNKKNIYAIGDVTDRINLTPVAIAEGHALADRIFGKKHKNILLDNVGTAVFSSPPICSVGFTEKEAIKKFKGVAVFESKFNSLKYSIVKEKTPTYIKLLVNFKNNRIIGAHMFGEESPEIIQLIAVAMEAKATIDDFKRTMAIHPTVAEELVTLKSPSRIFK